MTLPEHKHKLVLDYDRKTTREWTYVTVDTQKCTVAIYDTGDEVTLTYAQWDRIMAFTQRVRGR